MKKSLLLRKSDFLLIIFIYHPAFFHAMFYELIIGITLISLLIASYTDIKTREVPDWLNYSLIAVGIGIHAMQSIISLDWHPLVYSLLGFGAMFLLAYLMFYTGQWG